MATDDFSDLVDMSHVSAKKAEAEESFDSLVDMSHQSTFAADPHRGAEHLRSTYVGALPGKFNFRASFAEGLLRDKETKKRAVAKTMWPDDPNGASRLREKEGGLVYDDEKGQERYVTSGWSDFVGGLAAHGPSAVLGTAGTLLPMPGLGSVGGTAVGSTIEKAAAHYMYGQPTDLMQDATEVVKDTGMQGVLSSVPSALFKALNVGRPLTKGMLKDWELADAAAKQAAIRAKTGVNVDLALVSGNPNLGAIRNWLMKRPSGIAAEINEADTAAKAQFNVARDAFTDRVAGAAPATTQGEGARNAAQRYLDELRSNRKLATEDTYTEAGKKQLPNDVLEEILMKDPVYAKYSKEVERSATARRELGFGVKDQKETITLPNTKTRAAGQEDFSWEAPIGSQGPGQGLEYGLWGNKNKVFLKDKGLLQDARPAEGGFTPPTGMDYEHPVDFAAGKTLSFNSGEGRQSVKYWHTVKEKMDDDLETLRKTAPKSREFARLSEARNNLNTLLENHSDLYKTANAAYADYTNKFVKPAEGGAIGILSKVKDRDLAVAGVRMLRTEKITPTDVTKLRDAINTADPTGEAWDGLTRQYLESAINKAAKSKTSEAGSLYDQLWRDPRQRQVISNALGEDKAKVLQGVMEAAEAISKIPMRGSTSAQEALLNNSGVSMSLRARAGALIQKAGSPFETLGLMINGRSEEKNLARLWEALKDPAKVRDLQLAMKVSNPIVRATHIATVLGAQGTGPAINDLNKTYYTDAAEKQIPENENK